MKAFTINNKLIKVGEDVVGKTTPSGPDFPSSGLISYWRFNETSGTTAYDSFGDNNGSVSGALKVSGINNNALDFNNNTDIVTITNNNSLRISGDLTISVWIYIDETYPTSISEMFIFYKGVYPNYNYRLLWFPSTKKFEFFSYYNTWSPLFSTSSWDPGVWYNVVGVKNGLNLKIYVNGNLDGSKYTTGPSNTTTANLYMGRYHAETNGQYPFRGILDEVGLWNRALTPEEISDLYNSGNGTFY